MAALRVFQAKPRPPLDKHIDEYAKQKLKNPILLDLKKIHMAIKGLNHHFTYGKIGNRNKIGIFWDIKAYYSDKGAVFGIRFLKPSSNVTTSRNEGGVHGGAIAAIIDSSEAWAVHMVEGDHVVTGERTIRYVRPSKINEVYIVTCDILPHPPSSRKVQVKSVMSSLDGTTMVTALTTLFKVERKDSGEPVSKLQSKL